MVKVLITRQPHYAARSVNRATPWLRDASCAWRRLRAYLSGSMEGYFQPFLRSMGTMVSLMDRTDVHRRRLNRDPDLSLVPEARAPPKGCWPTMEPVDLSLM